ncbi:hypothetical protein HNY73_005035 [Argiope bruennichi]|uniref:Uncharacterized protein n=1 Tax=Argiope bruennichi TaxID=94029 RepID=A0A8T0FKQ0_ARGBR|nr:hypothetical protein HNY73_005035 [Argiope bruennichi]
MAFLAQSTIDDLKALAMDLGSEVTSDITFINTKDLITKIASYDANFCKTHLAFIQKKTKEEKAAEVKRVEKERFFFELEKLKIKPEMQKISRKETVLETNQPRMYITKVVPRFNTKDDEIGLYLTIFEGQLKFLSIPESKRILYLISSLPTEIAQLIAKEDEEDSQDYRKVKGMLLKRYRLTADSFRQLFLQHKKSLDTTWREQL